MKIIHPNNIPGHITLLYKLYTQSQLTSSISIHVHNIFFIVNINIMFNSFKILYLKCS